MGKNSRSRCKKCTRFLHTIHDLTPYGDHGWKFSCCNIQYYKCNRDTCNHADKDRSIFFYSNTEYLNNHIEKYHMNQNEEEDAPVILDKYVDTCISITSYEKSSSIGNYFTDNHSIRDSSFSYAKQRDAIKNIITMACNQSRGGMTAAKQICDTSLYDILCNCPDCFCSQRLGAKVP